MSTTVNYKIETPISLFIPKHDHYHFRLLFAVIELPEISPFLSLIFTSSLFSFWHYINNVVDKKDGIFSL